jgi:hypothetical protein
MEDKDKRGKRMQDLLDLIASMPKIEEPNYSWAIHKLEEEFPGLKLDRVYGMFPTQAEGKFHGMGVYARYRWDVFSITMGEQGENKILPEQDYYYESEGYIDDGDGGFLTPEAFYKEFQKGFSKILSQI